MVYLVMIFGLMIGSFLNVCIYRIPKKESIAYPPSHCTSCNTRLKAIELIPVLSFLFYRGKCRYCGSEISYRYPMVELLTALFITFLYMHFDLTSSFFMYSILACLLLVIAFIDYDTQEIPDGLIIAGLLTGIIFIALNGFKSNYINSILGLLLGGGLFLLIAAVSGGAMGGGDIKLMGVLGLWFGCKLILSVSMIAFIIGAVVSILLIVLKIKNRKDYIPFGPFIVISALINILYGSEIISLYIRLLMYK